MASALITGASSGIGLEFAKLLAAKDYDLVLVARRQLRLREIQRDLAGRHNVKVETIAVDLADRNAARFILDSIEQLGADIEVFVSNAGYSLSGDFCKRNLKEHVDLVQVNSLTPMMLAHGLIPGMIAKGEGKMLFVASVAGALYGGKKHGIYVASKAFLIRLALSLGELYRERGISVSVVLPGVVSTEFHQRAGTEALQREAPRFAVKSAAEVADESLGVLFGGVPYQVIGLTNRIMVLLVRFLPIGIGLKLVQS